MRTSYLLIIFALFSILPAILHSQNLEENNGWCSDSSAIAPDIESAEAWASWGADFHNLRSRSVDETGLTASNIHKLQLKWAFAITGVKDMRSQPTVTENWLYLAGRDSTIRALDAKTGCIRWETTVKAPLRSGTVLADLGRDHPGLLAVDDAGNIHALDAMTGAMLWSVRADKHKYAWITGTPVPYKGKVYVPVSSIEVAMAQNPTYECCTFRGKVVALNAKNGEIIWTYTTVANSPKKQDTNDSGATLWGPSGASVWSSVTIDENRNRLYVGTGQNLTQPWTQESSAIHAIDIDTGERMWIFQGTEGDAWNMACTSEKYLPGLPKDHSDNCPEDAGPDFDFGAAPMLVTLPDDRQVLVAGQKSGVVFGLDPNRNGSVIWKTRVGRGGKLGGVHWGMAADGKVVYVPISDRADGKDYEQEARPGMVALDASNGKLLWSVAGMEGACENEIGCHPGFSSPPTAIPGAVLAGSLNGYLQSFSSEDGRRLWSFNATREIKTVNGTKGRGGSIDVAGPVVAGNMVYMLSGYGTFGQMPGNLLLAFSLE